MATMRRYDGRAPGEMRGKELRTGELEHFNGSAYYSQGQTAVVVSLTGPIAARIEDYRRCQLEVKVLRSCMVPQAGGAARLNHAERQRALIEQDTEIAATVEGCVAAAAVLEHYPRCALAISIDVLMDDGSLLATVVNATMCAILDAGLVSRTTFAAVAVKGSLGSSINGGEKGGPMILLDPTKLEEEGGRDDDAGDAANATAKGAALGTFIFSNPSCGGGLLASVVRTAPSTAQAGAAPPFPTQLYAEMELWALKATSTMFEFLRNCSS